MRLGKGWVAVGGGGGDEDGEIGTSVGEVPDVCLRCLCVRPHAIVLKGLSRTGNKELMMALLSHFIP